MSDVTVVPELRQIVGALVFGANRPLSVREIRTCLVEVAEAQGGALAVFAQVSEKDIRAAVEELAAAMTATHIGFTVAEVAGGYKLQSDASCGPWLKQLLDVGSRSRLSLPALETLAIIAYRQPITRADIEGVRGVNVDHMVRILLELQLIRISGRSELPGRPFQYGTTTTFLEHFGLRDIKELSDMQPMLAQFKRQTSKAADKAVEPVIEKPAPASPAAPRPDAAEDKDRDGNGEPDEDDKKPDQDNEPEEGAESEDPDGDDDELDEDEDDDEADEEDEQEDES